MLQHPTPLRTNDHVKKSTQLLDYDSVYLKRWPDRDLLGPGNGSFDPRICLAVADDSLDLCIPSTRDSVVFMCQSSSTADIPRSKMESI